MKCRRTKTSLLEPRVLAKDKTTNEVDEAILKSVVTGIVKGGLQENFEEKKQESQGRQGYVKDENQDNVCCEVLFSLAVQIL